MTAIAMAEQERRQTVTVLFIDIVGFTSLVDDLDCAVVRALQRDYFGIVSGVVRAGGGVVEKYVGDAVMAVFGTGSAGFGAEAAASAVRVGLSVQEALRGQLLAGRFSVRTRVGLATGDVIVDLEAAHDGGQAMISGSVVSTAARLQAFAPHDTVVVCPQTRAAAGDLIAFQELPPVRVPGKPRALDLYRALEPHRARTATRHLYAVPAAA
ncbi:adenylate/guanylate cyclase domain-containing protein [Paractinoplanes lichenicola]|uniref:Adenylate/guanylate cyclase domain-containing protein n=1 Tax=Paractinoplanes lichenicola TaxID=2802976 RepID=A0ABS1VI67_9ACTN|nr:adenylate/guanylate cyclase domain-containing protein [Actinoplanes lichenicola]MBL7254345.1 adenylate/guanylate cyclase domain-containing protein [Actinoplanes lichenicola]